MQERAIAQNSHYTFKYNAALGRHGWLRLTPAYSVKLVEEILDSLDYTPCCVLEPFSGTGTTELVCANKGIHSIALELNPFLVWLGNVKLKIFSQDTINDFIRTADSVSSHVDLLNPSPLPSIHNISRWWGNEQSDFLARLKTGIDQVEDNDVKDLLLVAFCRSVIEFSNAAFNHVSTSFKKESDCCFSFSTGRDIFKEICRMVADGASQSPKNVSEVILNDSRKIPEKLYGVYDTVITSPPYPNRMSYIRELRPYMYWTDFLKTTDQASTLDWNAIGGTWGKATSMLTTWKPEGTLPEYVYNIAHMISQADNRSALQMSNYVLKYFEDIFQHLTSVYQGLKDGGKAFYIIGNSNFYGISVPAEKIYLDLMQAAGFTNTNYNIVRKRNCNKQLYEYVITGEKHK